MEPECSLPHSQQTATCPYSQPGKSSSCALTTPWKPILILSSHLCLRLPSGLLPSLLPTKILSTPFLSPIPATRLAQPILLYLINLILFGKVSILLSYSLCSILHSPLTSSLLGSNIFLNTLFSNTLILRSSLNVRDQVSDRYKTTGYLYLCVIWSVCFLLHINYCHCYFSGPGSSVGIATGYGWTVRGSNPGGGEIFRTSSDRPCDPPSLLCNGYRVFPGDEERPGHYADPSPPFSAVVMKG